MKTYKYTKVHKLTQLNGELLAAIPALAPVPFDDPVIPNAREAVFSLSGRETDNAIIITVADDVAEADIARVVRAHVANPDFGKETRYTLAQVAAMPSSEARWIVFRRLGLLEE